MAILVEILIFFASLYTNLGTLASICNNPDRRAVKAGSVNYSLSCTKLGSNDTANWDVSINDVLSETLQCSLADCTPTSSSFQVTRPSSDRSQLTFLNPLTLGKTTDNVTVRCTDGSVEKALYYLDIYEEGSVKSSYSVNQSSNGDWVIYLKVEMTGIRSTNLCYDCLWYQGNGTAKTSLRIADKLTKSVITGDPSQGRVHITCSFNQTQIPNTTGLFYYQVSLFYKRYTINITSIAFRLPGPPKHNCPDLIPEGETLTCECKPDSNNVGMPNRTFRWDISGTRTLTMANVSREDEGTMFRCMEQTGIAVKYILRVAYGPTLAFISNVTLNGTNYLLTCSAMGSYPPAIFTWKLAGSSQVLSRNQELMINAEDLNKGSKWECEARNGKTGFEVVTYFPASGRWPPQHQEACSNDHATGVLIGMGIILLVMLLFIVALIVLLLKGWRGPYADRKLGRHSKQRTDQPGVVLMDITDRDNNTDTENNLRTSHGDKDMLEERGYPEGASNYEPLDAQQNSNTAAYDKLSSLAPDLRHSKPLIKQDSSPLYENSADVLYANTT